MRRWLVRIVLVATALAALSGSAASGAWVSPAQLTLTTPAASRLLTSHACQADNRTRHAPSAGRHFATVACEQPPRSEPNLAGLSRASAAAAFASVG